MSSFIRFAATRRGVIVLAACYLVFLVTFLWAYSRSDKSVRVYIDRHGEADLELLSIILTFPAALAFILKGIKEGS